MWLSALQEFGRCFVKRCIDVMCLRVKYGRYVNADDGALLLVVAEHWDVKLAMQLATGTTEVFSYVSNFGFHTYPTLTSLPLFASTYHIVAAVSKMRV